MKKIIWGALVTVSGVVLLFSYRTSLGAPVATAVATSATTTTSSGSSASSSAGSTGSTGSNTTNGGSSSTGSSGSSASSGDTSGSGAALKAGAYTGQAVDTRWGPVQVQITVSDGKITAVDIPQYPHGNGRDVEINQRALPQLVSETLSAQSAQIDMVSGATYTSDGYIQSLQSAIDQAA